MTTLGIVATLLASFSIEAQVTFRLSVTEDRTPVLLVPGWSDGRAELDPLRGRLVRAGWAPHTIRAVEFPDPEGSNAAHAETLAAEVQSLIGQTEASKVDIVAHSMGGLAVRRFLLDGGSDFVRRVVFLATPHQGTVSAQVVWGDGAREMEPGSAFLLGLIRSPPVPPGVRALTIRTPVDLHILPGESATLPGVPDVEVCCPTHAGLLDDEETFRTVERFLSGN